MRKWRGTFWTGRVVRMLWLSFRRHRRCYVVDCSGDTGAWLIDWLIDCWSQHSPLSGRLIGWLFVLIFRVYRFYYLFNIYCSSVFPQIWGVEVAEESRTETAMTTWTMKPPWAATPPPTAQRCLPTRPPTWHTLPPTMASPCPTVVPNFLTAAAHSNATTAHRPSGPAVTRHPPRQCPTAPPPAPSNVTAATPPCPREHAFPVDAHHAAIYPSISTWVNRKSANGARSCWSVAWRWRRNFPRATATWSRVMSWGNSPPARREWGMSPFRFWRRLTIMSGRNGVWAPNGVSVVGRRWWAEPVGIRSKCSLSRRPRTGWECMDGCRVGNEWSGGSSFCRIAVWVIRRVVMMKRWGNMGIVS